MKRVILLADDSPTIQRLVAQTFQGVNFEIVAVSNGDAAIRKFEEIRPALILADIYMPGRNGYEVCAYVKKHSQLSQTPVVLLAGAFDAFDDETAHQVGAATHVTKPFEPHALVNLVESLLSAVPETPSPAPVASAEPPAESNLAAPQPSTEQPAEQPAEQPKDERAEEPKDEPARESAAPEALSPAEQETPATKAPAGLREPPPPAEPIPAATAVELTANADPSSRTEPAEPAHLTDPGEPKKRVEQEVAPVSEPAMAASSSAPPSPLPASTALPAAPAEAASGDLMGLQELFKPSSADARSVVVTDEEIDRIAERVIQKLSTQVIESVAWDVVPDITTKVLREELKRQS